MIVELTPTDHDSQSHLCLEKQTTNNYKKKIGGPPQ